MVRHASWNVKYIWNRKSLYWFITQTCLTMGGNTGLLGPRASHLTAKTYVWVPRPGEQMIKTYLSGLMLGLKGILNHYPRTDKINIYYMLTWYNPFFPQRGIFQNVLEITTLIEQRLGKGKETSCSKFQEKHLCCFGFWNALSDSIPPAIPGSLTEISTLRPSLRGFLSENTASSPDRANMWISLYWGTCVSSYWSWGTTVSCISCVVSHDLIPLWVSKPNTASGAHALPLPPPTLEHRWPHPFTFHNQPHSTSL